ncbi:MAG: Zn-ribbon domain-containing protein [Candidatus Micrarchaeota archaeon]|nr:Zn-ribbon domain-containing protein [Candidatus Micrarchaeota archaeon]
MHKCVRCGRAAKSLKEINDGCPCGAKVFIFNRQAVCDAGSEGGKPAGEGAGGVATEEGWRDAKAGAEGRVPPSYHARMSFSSEDVENIKIISKGVFALELHSLSRDPIVLKDEDGVYYVKIPFEQNGKAAGKDKKRTPQNRSGGGFAPF